MNPEVKSFNNQVKVNVSRLNPGIQSRQSDEENEEEKSEPSARGGPPASSRAFLPLGKSKSEGTEL